MRIQSLKQQMCKTALEDVWTKLCSLLGLPSDVCTLLMDRGAGDGENHTAMLLHCYYQLLNAAACVVTLASKVVVTSSGLNLFLHWQLEQNSLFSLRGGAQSSLVQERCIFLCLDETNVQRETSFAATRNCADEIRRKG